MTIEDLYSGKATLEVKFNFIATTFDVSFQHHALNSVSGKFEVEPDCKVENWAENRFFRTPKGEVGEKYKSIGTLKRAISMSSEKRGLTVEKFIIKDI